MKFNNALKNNLKKKTKPDTSISSREPKTAYDPKDYPNPLIMWDTGATDRGLTGFPSDWNVLTQRELMGVIGKKGHKHWKDTDITNNDGKSRMDSK